MFVSGKLFLITLKSANIRLGWKGLPGKMAFSLFVSDKESSFSLLLAVEKNKLERFFPVIFFLVSLIFVLTAEAYIFLVSVVKKLA